MDFRKCPRCDIEFDPITLRCSECGKLDTIGIDGNHSGFTEVLGNTPLTRLLIGLEAWPDWISMEALCDAATVHPSEAYRFIELWEDWGIVMTKDDDETGEILYKLDVENPVARKIMELNSAILLLLDEEDEE